MKKPVVLLIILAGLIAFAFFYKKQRDVKINSGSLVGVSMREFVLPDVAGKDVGGLHIQEGEKQVHVSATGDVWTVAERSGYRASREKVQRALTVLSEMKPKGKQEVGKSILGEVKLLPPGEGAADRTGLLVEVLDDKSGPVTSLIAGGSTTTSGGASAASSNNMFGGPGEMRYVRVPNSKDQSTVWLVGDSFYELSSDPKDWLDKAFVDVRKLKSIEITMPNAADSWKAERKDEEAAFAFVNVAPGEELDTAKADGLNNVLSSAMFNDVLAKDKVTADTLKGAVKAKLVTFEGFTYEIEALEQKATGSEGADKGLVSLKVSADIPKERKPAADEKPEDKKKKDDEFAAANKPLQDKLAKEKAAEGWVYEMPTYSMNVLFKKRSDLVRDKQPAPAPAPEPAGPSTFTVPLGPGPKPPGAPSAPIMPPAALQSAPAGAKPSAAAPPANPAPPPAAAPAKPAEATTPPVEAKPTTPPAKPAPTPPGESKPSTDAKPAADTKPAEEAKPKTDAK